MRQSYIDNLIRRWWLRSIELRVCPNPSTILRLHNALANGRPVADPFNIKPSGGPLWKERVSTAILYQDFVWFWNPDVTKWSLPTRQAFANRLRAITGAKSVRLSRRSQGRPRPVRAFELPKWEDAK